MRVKMFFLSSTIPAKKDKQKKKNRKAETVTTEAKIFAFIIFGFWGILLLFGLISISKPDWLVKISEPGKNVEVLTIKRTGDQFLRNKKYSLAASAYKQALKIKPDMYSARGNLGIVYSKMGYYNKAISTFKYLLKHNPERSYTSYHNIAEIYEKTDQIEKATKNYVLCAKTAPFPSYALSKAGFLYIKQDSLDLAIDYLQQSLDNRRDMSQLYEGMLEKAIPNYSDDSKKRNAIQTALDQGISKDDLKRYDFSVFETSLKKDRELAKAHNFIGTAYFKKNDLEKAQLHFKKALQIWPNFIEARDNLKTILAIQKDIDKLNAK
jgi:tetratricopeptide (TPR) repeat protein